MLIHANIKFGTTDNGLKNYNYYKLSSLLSLYWYNWTEIEQIRISEDLTGHHRARVFGSHGVGRKARLDQP